MTSTDLWDTWQLRTAPRDLTQRWQADGSWNDDTFPETIRRGLAAHPDATFRIHSKVRPYDGTVGAVGDAGLRLAGALAQRGIGTNDIVAFQLPNWSEVASCFYGLLCLGAVLVPIVHIYGPKELRHILRESRARVLITTDVFGRQNFIDNVDAIADGLDDLELVVVVDNKGAGRTQQITSVGWNELISGADRLEYIPHVEPDAPAIVGYTSGTTSAPKGVVHTHRTMLAELRQLEQFERQDPFLRTSVPSGGSLSGSPISHITGLIGVLMPLQHGGPINLIDQWDAATVLERMLEHQLSSGSGATFFLTSLLDHPNFDPDRHLQLIRRSTLGGSPIPADVASRAASLGIVLRRAYGSTEHPSTTGALTSDPEAKRLYTDGRCMPSVEVDLRDADGRSVAAGEPGEIFSRGPDLFVGYTEPTLTADTLTADGWYATGDIGVVDPEGYLTITDRKKDIIIRGGENISASEVEELLQTLTGVAEVAVVAAPDPRYGERGCAMVRLTEGQSPFALTAVQAHLERAGLARQKWPEELHFVDDFPRTASGKIQKHILRDSMRS